MKMPAPDRGRDGRVGIDREQRLECLLQARRVETPIVPIVKHVVGVVAGRRAILKPGT
jgi:hypothetical protein